MIARQLVPRFVVLAAGLVASCARNPAAPPSEQLDHVILGISNLDRGIEQLGALCGVKPVPGGKHPDTGTQNALLSMGSRAYAEVLAPQDGVQLAPMYQPLRAVANLLPVGWAVATRDAELTIQKLRAAGFAVSEPQARITANSRWNRDSLANFSVDCAKDRRRALLHRVGCDVFTSRDNLPRGMPAAVTRVAHTAR